MTDQKFLSSRIIRFLKVLSLLVLISLPEFAFAEPTLIISDGTLTGIQNITVGDGVYDVQFVTGSFTNIFVDESGLTFTTREDAIAASVALDAAMIDGPDGNFDTEPWLTYGCFAVTDYYESRCSIGTPYLVLNDWEEGRGLDWVSMAMFENYNELRGDSVSGPSNTFQSMGFGGTYVYAVWTFINDSDSDQVPDVDDNCPNTSNPDQTDTESDGIGDACDVDDDNDGVGDPDDNCPFVENLLQDDLDGDGVGSSCDGDLDGDGYDNANDNSPHAYNPDQTDTDGDGEGDESDSNDDNDTCIDSQDNCPTVPNPGQEDLDNDGIGDVCDIDVDGDGIENDGDNCELIANTSQDDTDNDGKGDACDIDDDNDGIADDSDNCPLAINIDQTDSDSDGKGDACNDANDSDDDEWSDSLDNCPNVANYSQSDLDLDGEGDTCDADIDGDGVANDQDECANTITDELVGARGCSLDQLCPCNGPRGTTQPWRNHGKYVSCMAHATNDLLSEGLITEAEKDTTMSSAAESTCGKN